VLEVSFASVRPTEGQDHCGKGTLRKSRGISYGLIQALREQHINVVDYKPTRRSG
jgi:hypothetical protein